MEIRLTDLSLTRGETSILRGIDWHLRSGERWLVVGENGAGKTQLLKILAGDVWPDSRESASIQYRFGRHWQSVLQERKSEIAYLGPEQQDKYERYGWNFPVWQVIATGLARSDIPLHHDGQSEKRQAEKCLKSAGALRFSGRLFLELSYGERRRFLLLRALASTPQLLLLDELVTGLDATHRQRVFAALKRQINAVNAAGLAWVATAHRHEDVPPGVTHFLQLCQGQIVDQGPATLQRIKKAFDAKLLRPKVAVSVRSAATTNRLAQGRVASRPVLIEMQNAQVFLEAKRVLSELDWQIRQGECWVVHGTNGAGKSTLLRCLYGDHAVADGGVIRRRGIEPGVPLEQFQKRVGVVAPQLQTDYPRWATVLETLVSGLHASIGLNASITDVERRRAKAVAKRYDLEQMLDRTLAEMSYGQRRRVLFARAAMAQPRLWLLDEPFAGLDVNLRQQLQAQIDQEVRQGRAVVIVTHYRREWPQGTTHELQLSGGKPVYIGPMRR